MDANKAAAKAIGTFSPPPLIGGYFPRDLTSVTWPILRPGFGRPLP